MEAATIWRDLGLELLPYKHYEELDIIQFSYPSDCVQCCMDVFKKWLEITEDASWNELIRALRRVQLYLLANRLERMIREGELYSTCR